MDIENFLKIKELEGLNVKETDLDSIKKIINNIDFNELKEYVVGLSKYPLTSGYKKFSIKDLDTTIEKKDVKEIEKFIKGANTNFKRFSKEPENKEDRNIYNIIKNLKINMDSFALLNEKYIDNKHLMKKENITISSWFKEIKNRKDQINVTENLIERLNDFIDKSRIESNAYKLLNSIISNKYKFLINEETINIFKECSKQNITKKDLQNHIAPKIAAMKDSSEFNTFIIENLGFKNLWTKDFLKEKINKNGAEVLLEDGYDIYVEISTFEQSKKLGSKMWCLTRSEKELENYLYKNHSRLVFKFDTSKNIMDESSYTAMLYNNNSLFEIFDKNDNPYKEGSLFEKINNIELPKQSDLTKNNKIEKYKNLLETNFHFEKRAVRNLISLNSFNIIEKIKKDENIDKLHNSDSWLNNDLIDFLKDIDNKETYINLLENNEIITQQKRSENNILNFIILTTTACNNKITKEDIKSLSRNNLITSTLDNISTKVKKDNKNINLLSDTEFLFETDNIEKVGIILDVFKDIGIMPSHFSSSQTLHNLDSKMLLLFIEKEPNYIEKCFELNPRRAILSLSNNVFEPELEKKIIKSIPKDDKISKLIEKRLKVLGVNGDQEIVKRLEKWVKKENKLKLKL